VQDLDADGGQAVAGQHALELRGELHERSGGIRRAEAGKELTTALLGEFGIGEVGLQLVDLHSTSLVLVTALRFSARHCARVVVGHHGRAQLVARVGREARGEVLTPVRLARDGEQLHKRDVVRAREEGKVVFDGPQVAANPGRVERVAGGVPAVDLVERVDERA
jgi:hypothetical protein